jgi:hypothetical protein
LSLPLDALSHSGEIALTVQHPGMQKGRRAGNSLRHLAPCVFTSHGFHKGICGTRREQEGIELAAGKRINLGHRLILTNGVRTSKSAEIKLTLLFSR